MLLFALLLTVCGGAPLYGAPAARAASVELPSFATLYVEVDPRRHEQSAQGQLVTGGSLPSGAYVDGAFTVADLTDPAGSAGGGLIVGNETWELELGFLNKDLSSLVEVKALGMDLSYTPQGGGDPRVRVMSGVRAGKGLAAASLTFGTKRLRLTPAFVLSRSLSAKAKAAHVASLGSELKLASWLSLDAEVAAGTRSNELYPQVQTPARDETKALTSGVQIGSEAANLRLEATRVGAGFAGRSPFDERQLGSAGTQGVAARGRAALGPFRLSLDGQRYFDTGYLAGERTVNDLSAETRLSLGRRQSVSFGGGLVTEQTGYHTLRRWWADSDVHAEIDARVEGNLGKLHYGLGWEGRDRIDPGVTRIPQLRERTLQLRMGRLRTNYAVGRENVAGIMQPYRRIDLGVGMSIPRTPADLHLSVGRRERPDDETTARASAGISFSLGDAMQLEFDVSLKGVERRGGSAGVLRRWAYSFLSPEAERWIGVNIVRYFSIPLSWVKDPEPALQ